MTASPEEQEFALDRAINGLRQDYPIRSASTAVWGWQKPTLIALLVLTVGMAAWQPMRTAILLIGLCTVGYVLTMIDRVLIFKEGLDSRAIVVSDEKARAVPDSELPRYTILVPAYNEPEVVGQLIGAMRAEEEALLEQRQTSARGAASFASVLMWSGCSFLFLLICGTAFLLSRDHKAREAEVWLKNGQAALVVELQGELQVIAFEKVESGGLAHQAVAVQGDEGNADHGAQGHRKLPLQGRTPHAGDPKAIHVHHQSLPNPACKGHHRLSCRKRQAGAFQTEAGSWGP